MSRDFFNETALLGFRRQQVKTSIEVGCEILNVKVDLGTFTFNAFLRHQSRFAHEHGP